MTSCLTNDKAGDVRRESLLPVKADILPRRCVQLVLLLLAYKAFILWFVFASVPLLPGLFNQEGYASNFHWPENKQPGIEERFMTWDGEHYIYLSQQGYQAGSFSCAMYPLYPGLIWLGTKLAPTHRLAIAVLLSNILSLAAWVLFHRFVALRHNEDLADWSLAFLVAFPGSLFFQFPYSESLFFLLTMVFFWGLFQNKQLYVTASGFLLPCTRAVGLFSIFPLLVHERFEIKRLRQYLPFIAIFGGWCAYLLIMTAYTGNAFEGFVAQEQNISSPSISKLFDPIAFVQAFFTPLQLHGFMNSVIDRCFFVCFLFALFPTYKMSKEYFVYAVGAGLIPAITSSFCSFTRYLSVVFPLFIVAAAYFSEGDRKQWRLLVIALLFALQILLLLRHVNFLWAG